MQVSASKGSLYKSCYFSVTYADFLSRVKQPSALLTFIQQ